MHFIELNNLIQISCSLFIQLQLVNIGLGNSLTANRQQAIRHQVITWASFALDLCRHIVPLDPNELSFICHDACIYFRWLFDMKLYNITIDTYTLLPLFDVVEQTTGLINSLMLKVQYSCLNGQRTQRVNRIIDYQLSVNVCHTAILDFSWFFQLCIYMYIYSIYKWMYIVDTGLTGIMH